MFFAALGGSPVAPQNPPATGNSINLQATLSAATAGAEACLPHHPITCSAGALQLYEDGALECGHVRTESGDHRTQDAVAASVAILLFELVHERFGSTPRSS